MTQSQGLINAFLLDGNGGGRQMGWDDIRQWIPSQGVLWVHLDFTDAEALQWLRDESGLNELVVDALTADETRPRITTVEDGMLVSLRGVNNNPGAEPEDMVSIRLFCTQNRVISTRRRKLMSITDLVNSLEQGEGPCNPGELITMLADRLVERMSVVISELDDRIDELEESMITGTGQEVRSSILELRGEIIKLRRYLSPQREALSRLYTQKTDLLGEHDKLEVREILDQITRYVEDLDSIRDRAGVAYEELSNRLAEQMNNRMYVLSLIAGLFLPLGFLTGLLGVNVGGIPLSDNHWGFLAVVFFMILMVVIQVVIFRRKNWF
jgi:zinc transporter